MTLETNPLIALDEDIKEYSIIRVINKLSYLMILISILAILVGLGFIYFALSIFSIILLVFGLYSFSQTRDILSWTSHIKECRETSNNLYRVEVSQADTTKIFINNLIFSALTIQILLNLVLRWPEFHDIVTNIAKYFPITSEFSDAENIDIFLYSYIGLAGLFFIYCILASNSAQKYVTFPYSAYSDLIFKSNWLLLFFSIAIVWSTDQPSQVLDNEIWNISFPDWIIEYSQLLFLVMIGVTVFIWTINSRQYRVGYSLFFLIFFFTTIFTAGLTAASWYYSRHVYSKSDQDSRELNIYKIASIHENDIVRYGCPTKYLPDTLNCVPGTRFKEWEQVNETNACINLGCQTSATKVQSDRFFDLSNLLLFSTISQFLVFLGLYNFSFNFTFVYDDGKKTKDYVWLALMLFIIVIGGLSSFYLRSPDLYVNYNFPIAPYKSSYDSPLSGLKTSTQYLSASFISEIERNLNKNEFELVSIWNRSSKVFEIDTFLMLDKQTWNLTGDDCVLYVHKEDSQTYGRFLTDGANCRNDKWIFRTLRSELLSSGLMIETQNNPNNISIQELFFWSMVNSKLIEPLDIQLLFSRSFTLYSWNEDLLEIELALETDIFDDISKSITRNKQPLLCLYSDKNYNNTISLFISGQRDDNATVINREFDIFNYECQLRDIKTYNIDKSEFKKDKLTSLIKNI